MSDNRLPRTKKNSGKTRYVSFFHLFSTHQQFIWVKYPYQNSIGLKPFPHGRQNSIQLHHKQKQINNQPHLGINQINNTLHTPSWWNIPIHTKHQKHNRAIHKVQRGRGAWTQVEETALLGNQNQPLPAERDSMDMDSNSPAAIVQQSPVTMVNPLVASPPLSPSTGNSAEGSISGEATGSSASIVAEHTPHAGQIQGEQPAPEETEPTAASSVNTEGSSESK